MVKRLSISVSDWVFNDILANEKNVSSKIEELLIKGYVAELKKHKDGADSVTKKGQLSEV